MQEAARDVGLQATVAVDPMQADDAHAAIAHLSEQVDGFLFLAPRSSDAALARAVSAAPSVLVDRELDGVASVTIDTASAFEALATELVGCGHTTLAYVGGPAGSWQDRQRETALRRATDGRAELVVLGPYPSTYAAGLEVVDAVLDSGATAVIPYTTAISIGLILALRQRGVDVPGDMVVSTERVIADAIGSAGIPAIDVPGEELGRVAMKMLLSEIEGTSERAQVRLSAG